MSVLLIVLLSTRVQAQRGLLAAKSDRFVPRMAASGSVSGFARVVVRLSASGTALSASQSKQVAHLGGSVYRSLPIIHSLAVRLPRRNLERLAALPFVQHLSADALVRKFDEFTVQGSLADVAAANYGVTGNGVTVAVIDSGVRYMTDLQTTYGGQNRLLYAGSFITGDTNPDDLCGHGTHIAGIVAGNGAMSTGSNYSRTFYGIAPKSNLVSLRVLNANGQGIISDVIAAIQYAVASKAKFNIRVINLSLGHPVGESYKTDPLCQAVESAWKSGIVVVCAAGNAGRLNDTQTDGDPNEGWGTAYGSIQSPANDPYVITVGAMKNVDGTRQGSTIGTYSARGPSAGDFVLKPDLVAPGNKVISLYSTNSTLYAFESAAANGLPMTDYFTGSNGYWCGYSPFYFVLSGTSMSAPVVSGAAALLLEKYPNLSPNTVKARLMLTADKWSFPDGTADPCAFGAGYVNIAAALGSNVTATTSALSPTLSVKNGTISISTSIVVSKKGVWGIGSGYSLQSIWGSNQVNSNAQLVNPVLSASDSVWGTQVLWIGGGGGKNKNSALSVDLSTIAVFGE